MEAEDSQGMWNGREDGRFRHRDMPDWQEPQHFPAFPDSAGGAVGPCSKFGSLNRQIGGMSCVGGVAQSYSYSRSYSSTVEYEYCTVLVL